MEDQFVALDKWGGRVPTKECMQETNKKTAGFFRIFQNWRIFAAKKNKAIGGISKYHAPQQLRSKILPIDMETNKYLRMPRGNKLKKNPQRRGRIDLDKPIQHKGWAEKKT